MSPGGSAIFGRACLAVGDCPSTTPPCPKCASDETCILTPRTCTQCPVTSCVKTSLTDTVGPTSTPPPKGSNTGAIAGGVVGGIAAVAIVTWLVWKFCLKGRRQQQLEEEEWEADTVDAEKRERFTMRRDARASTHTVGSIASTVFTRASNIIQIAYIPGVTNRSPPSSPGLLVPPVPPLPISGSSSAASTPNYQHDQHFFMPGDLRDSTYSGISDGRSMRTSITPSLARSSVATTIFRSHSVIEPVPQTVIRGKAAMVSVKSTGGTSPTPSPAVTPPVPSIDFERHGQKGLTVRGARDSARDLAPPASPAFSIGSTFLNSTANTAKAVTARPVQVTRTKPSTSATEVELAPFILDDTAIRPERPRVSVSTSASTHSRALRNDISTDFDDSVSDDEDKHSRYRRSLSGQDGNRESLTTVIEDNTPHIAQSPFSDVEISSSPDTPQQPNQNRHSVPRRATSGLSRRASGMAAGGSLGVVIEEAAKRASRDPTHGGLGSIERGSSPFGDENEIQESKGTP